MKIFLEQIFYKRLPIFFVGYIIAFELGFIWYQFFALFLMLFLCRFDAIGYGSVLGDQTEHSIPLVNYRIQGAEISFIMFTLTILVMFLLGYCWLKCLYVIVGFVLAFWFGIKDFLYYIARDEYLGDFVFEDNATGSYTLEQNKWSWMYWTPIGIYQTIVQHKSFKRVFIDHSDRVFVWIRYLKYQALVGLVVTVLFLIFI